jgi:hypothetical protein
MRIFEALLREYVGISSSFFIKKEKKNYITYITPTFDMLDNEAWRVDFVNHCSG